MSVDKLVDSAQLDAGLTTVANAIRAKGGTTEQLSFPSGMAQAIADIPSGGGGSTTSKTIDVTLANDVKYADGWLKILSNDADINNHYTESQFLVSMYYLGSLRDNLQYLFLTQTNMDFSPSNPYGIVSSISNTGGRSSTYVMKPFYNGKNYAYTGVCSDGNGDLYIKCNDTKSAACWKAGNYRIVIGW